MAFLIKKAIDNFYDYFESFHGDAKEFTVNFLLFDNVKDCLK